MQIPPPPPPTEPAKRSWLTIAAVGLAVVLGAALLLVAPTGFIGPVVVFGSFLFTGLVGLHYVVWGRWLTRVLREQHPEEDAEGKI